MTIEAKGFVYSIGYLAGDRVELTLQLEAERSTNRVVIEASMGETEMYRPGTPVVVQVRPTPSDGTKP